MFAISIALLGLLFLVIGGDLLVRGAVNIAQFVGLSPLVIGLTLVGFGTSTPELVTSVRASMAGAPGIAYGNIVGSNIANILLILGLSAICVDLAVSSKVLKRDGLMMFAATLGFAGIAAFGEINRVVGALGLAWLVAYIFIAIKDERRRPVVEAGALSDKAQAAEGVDPALNPMTPPSANLLISIGLVWAGLAGVIAGGYLLVDGSITLARNWGVSETIIGLTIVAIGTSAPELVTSLMAALKKEGELAFGNVVGSNIYNILAIGGATALIAPSRVPESIIAFDMVVMILASVALLVFAVTGAKVRRWEGVILVVGYASYIIVLWP